jgi:hypothetical protein
LYAFLKAKPNGADASHSGVFPSLMKVKQKSFKERCIAARFTRVVMLAVGWRSALAQPQARNH